MFLSDALRSSLFHYWDGSGRVESPFLESSLLGDLFVVFRRLQM